MSAHHGERRRKRETYHCSLQEIPRNPYLALAQGSEEAFLRGGDGNYLGWSPVKCCAAKAMGWGERGQTRTDFKSVF